MFMYLFMLEKFDKEKLWMITCLRDYKKRNFHFAFNTQGNSIGKLNDLQKIYDIKNKIFVF